MNKRKIARVAFTAAKVYFLIYKGPYVMGFKLGKKFYKIKSKITLKKH